MELVQFIFSDFWVWLGALVMLEAVLKAIKFVWNRFMRHLNVRLRGWPPPHLDGDGDFKSDAS